MEILGNSELVGCFARMIFWLGREDSNLRMGESKSLTTLVLFPIKTYRKPELSLPRQISRTLGTSRAEARCNPNVGIKRLIQGYGCPRICFSEYASADT
jgi:hypothetical protein